MFLRKSIDQHHNNSKKFLFFSSYISLLKKNYANFCSFRIFLFCRLHFDEKRNFDVEMN